MCSAVVRRMAARAVASAGGRRHLQLVHNGDATQLLRPATLSFPHSRSGSKDAQAVVQDCHGAANVLMEAHYLD